MAQKMLTNKKVSAAVAAVLVVAIAVGGAYAWTDYSQTARNTFTSRVDAGVLLHDDFDGKNNKDVYVENTGSAEVFVRVKFVEYLQIGNDSILDAFGTTDGTDADPDDKTTWRVHRFNTAAVENACDLKEPHEYFIWNMTGGQKEYLAGVTMADGNGYGGLSKAQFDSYKVGDEVTLGGGITTYKRETAEKTDITMLSKLYELMSIGDYDSMSDRDKAAWDAIEKGCWLLDTDGWAYWSAALAPGKATNLLLDSVEPADKKPYDKWIYNIDVQLQAATTNEMDRWYLDGIKDIANPDNRIATVTDDGKKFIEWRTGVEKKEWEEIGTTNVFREVSVSVVGTKTPTGNYAVAGNDLKLETDDDNNMLCGRSEENYGGIPLNLDSIDKENPTTYTILGTNESVFYVDGGMDKALGTYDDIIRSVDRSLGAYDHTGDYVQDNIGWNYLYGSLDNMLVATEYVLDNIVYNAPWDANGYIYANSTVHKRMISLWPEFAMDSSIVKTVDALDMSTDTAVGITVNICTVPTHAHREGPNHNCAPYTGFGPYYTKTTRQSDINLTAAGTRFFALSLQEIVKAYGECTPTLTAPYPEEQRFRIALAGEKWAASNTAYKCNPYYSSYGVYTARYWLRTPAYIGSRAALASGDGTLAVTDAVNHNIEGIRPACYLNLEAQ